MDFLITYSTKTNKQRNQRNTSLFKEQAKEKVTKTKMSKLEKKKMSKQTRPDNHRSARIEKQDSGNQFQATKYDYSTTHYQDTMPAGWHRLCQKLKCRECRHRINYENKCKQMKQR